jgi:hypothetical protein
VSYMVLQQQQQQRFTCMTCIKAALNCTHHLQISPWLHLDCQVARHCCDPLTLLVRTSSYETPMKVTLMDRSYVLAASTSRGGVLTVILQDNMFALMLSAHVCSNHLLPSLH